VSKYDAMLRCVCSDGRIKGLTRFYGANRTGRWAGQLVQVQNLPQNHLLDLDAARQLVKQGDLETLQMMFGNVPDTLSQLIRTAFVGPFVVVDFNAIEARVLAWMSNCQWRMDVFNSHMKIYEASAEQMFKLLPGSVDKKSPYRQKGKIAELALGYGGGAGALKTMGALEMGLTEDELEPIKVAWRKANPEIVQFWYACESAAKRAILEHKPQTLAIGQRSELTFSYESGFLFIELPSKRRLAYVKPRLEKEDLVKDGYTVARTDSITYEGNDQKTKKWSRIGTYGGKLCENITQAVARDCLREAMFAVSDAGYSMVMTVHDEIVIETESGLEAITEIMSRPINWALGLPLKADGFATPYYCKEIQ
jgi:DNA polymerase